MSKITCTCTYCAHVRVHVHVHVPCMHMYMCRECVPELGNVRVVVAYVIVYFTCVPPTCLLLAATLLGPTGRFYKVYRQRAAPAAPGPGNGGKCVSHSRPGPQDVHASHEAPLSPRTPDPADLEHTQVSTARRRTGGRSPAQHNVPQAAIHAQKSRGGGDAPHRAGGDNRRRRPAATPRERDATRPRHNVRSARRPPRASLISDSDSPFAYRYRHIPPTLLR